MRPTTAMTPAGKDRMDQDNLQAWVELNIGDRVTVREHNGHAWLATVDAKTHDSSVVWVLADRGGRRAFDYRESVRLDTSRDAPQHQGPFTDAGFRR